jgi:hypothetical protein
MIQDKSYEMSNVDNVTNTSLYEKFDILNVLINFVIEANKLLNQNDVKIYERINEVVVDPEHQLDRKQKEHLI